MSRARIAAILLIALCGPPAFPGAPPREDPEDARIAAALEAIRLEHRVPALAGAILTGDGIVAIGAAGVRKAGTGVAATVDDRWHLGSDTKAMTATLIGVLVDQGKLEWTTTLEQAFPDITGGFAPELRRVSLLQLLSHRAGLPANLPWFALVKPDRSLREQRLEAVRALANVKLLSEPGSAYLYSNLGYVIAGAVVERTLSKSWEEAISDLVFAPLGMTSAGFGGLGTPGLIDQPWGHNVDGRPVPKNGPDVDNPAVLGPAGTVHATLRDWAKFVADQLRAGRSGKALLKPKTYEKLHTPPFGGDYALGWLLAERDWGGGTVMTHAGSNTMNFAVVWMTSPTVQRSPGAAVDGRSDALRIETPDGRRSPKGDFAVLVVTNQGPPAAAKACDAAAGALIKLFQAIPARRPSSSNHP
jgi:CubicO group peptidase (beta-lactamase class C family)